MIKNYFKIALRNLSKNKAYTFINSAGLAIGMGICLFLVLLTQYAYNFDKYHENSDRIYLLADEINQQNGSVLDVAISPSPWGKALEEDFPEIEESVRFLYYGRKVQLDDKVLRQGVHYVDDSIFDVFTYRFKFGQPEGALSRPNTIVLTEEMSERYFANQNPVGKTLLVDEEPFEVTGVLRKLNPQSTFYFNSLSSFSNLTVDEYSSLNDWRSHNLYTYVLLKEGTDVSALEAKFPEFISKHVGEEYQTRYAPHLVNLEDMFLFTDLYGEPGQSLEVSYLYIFAAIGLLILFIACINFINLATAQGIKRAREIGVRKVLGAHKKQLIFQFVTEAIIVAALAVVISLMFVELALPWFNDMAEWSVQSQYSGNPLYIFSIVLIVLLVGFFAGGYPAFFLSAFRPALVLKGQSTTNGKSKVKTALVVTQFTVAIFMIISTTAVDRQLSFLKTKNLGFETKDILVSSLPADVSTDQIETLREELFRIPGVQEVSFSSDIPGEEQGSRIQTHPEGEHSVDGLLVNTYDVDTHFLSQFDIELLAGQQTPPDAATVNSSNVLINETAKNKFGWDDPLGKTIDQANRDGELVTYTVTGLVKDFHYETLHNQIRPLIIRSNSEQFYDLSIKIRDADIASVTENITTMLKGFNGGAPVFYYFLEDDIADEYDTEEVIGEMLRYFTYLTMFIACLGLLGLVSFTIVNRKKEIGVRKVMGASVPSIVQSLSSQFIKLVIVGFVIGAPLAWFLINQWLKSFAYNNPPGVMTFAGSGIATILIAFITIGYQTFKAANANPVDSLRNE